MTLLDVNILVYAHDAGSPHHKAAKAWVSRLFEKPGLIGLPWITIWAFVRISTNPRLFARPLAIGEAFRIVRELLENPMVTLVEPGARHVDLLERMAAESESRGPSMTDAVLAALAVEHGAVLASADRGFSRFSGIRWVDPLSKS